MNTGVLTHVAEDYIPVIASVGADAEGNSYNINADDAAAAVVTRNVFIGGSIDQLIRKTFGLVRERSGPEPLHPLVPQSPGAMSLISIPVRPNLRYLICHP